MAAQASLLCTTGHDANVYNAANAVDSSVIHAYNWALKELCAVLLHICMWV